MDLLLPIRVPQGVHSFGVPGPEWVTGLGLAAPSSAAWLQSPISGRSLQEDSVLYILS